MDAGVLTRHTPLLSIIKTDHTHSTACDIYKYNVLKCFLTGKADQSQSSMDQCWILRPQKCQNFHVVTHRKRISGAGVWSVSPPQRNRALKLSFIVFFTLQSYQQSDMKPVNQGKYTFWITTPQVHVCSLTKTQNERIDKFDKHSNKCVYERK